MKTFILHWRGGKTEEVRGKTIAEAFSNAGYGAGALAALDWWEEVKMGEREMTIDEAIKVALSALHAKNTENEPCEFCNTIAPKPIESDGGEASLCKIIPMPAINLKTGKLSDKADTPYYALKVTWDDDEYDPLEDFFPIEYCPKCGRKLNAHD